MIEVGLNLHALPLRQRPEEAPDAFFALSADDGANLLDDNDQTMETFDATTNNPA